MGSVVGADLYNLNRQLSVAIWHVVVLPVLNPSVSVGSFSAAHHKFPSVRLVPFAASRVFNLKVRY